MNRRADVAAPEAGHVLKSPDQMVQAHGPEHKQIQGEGGGADIAVPQNEAAKQSSVGAVRGIVESAVAVHDEQKHVSVSQVGAGWNWFGAVLAVLVAEREVPGRMRGHEVEHPPGELGVVDACVPR